MICKLSTSFLPEYLHSEIPQKWTCCACSEGRVSLLEHNTPFHHQLCSPCYWWLFLLKTSKQFDFDPYLIKLFCCQKELWGMEMGWFLKIRNKTLIICIREKKKQKNFGLAKSPDSLEGYSEIHRFPLGSSTLPVSVNTIQAPYA